VPDDLACLLPVPRNKFVRGYAVSCSKRQTSCNPTENFAIVNLSGEAMLLPLDRSIRSVCFRNIRARVGPFAIVVANEFLRIIRKCRLLIGIR